MLPCSKLLARQLKVDYTSELSLLQVYQSSRLAGQTDRISTTIKNYRLGSNWTSPGLGLRHEGQISFNYGQGRGVKARQVEFVETIIYRQPRFNLQLSLTGLSRSSDGDLNLDLSQQLDRNRSIRILTNLNPDIAPNSNNQLYEERLGFIADANFAMTRQLQWNAGFNQQIDNRRNRLNQANLRQNNLFQSYNLGLDYRFLTRTSLIARLLRSHFITTNQASDEPQTLDQEFEIRQEDRSWELGISHQPYRTLDMSLSYIRLESNFQAALPSSIEGPSLLLQWQLNRLNSIAIQVRRVRLQQAQNGSTVEFGSFRYQRIFSLNSQIVIQVEKNYDTASTNFEAASNNQLPASSRRSSTTQANLEFNRTWRKYLWNNSLNFVKFEIDDTPNSTEQRLSSAFGWQPDREKELLTGGEFRQAANSRPNSQENLKIYGIFLSYQEKFFRAGNSRKEGRVSVGLNHEWSIDEELDVKVQRFAINIGAGLVF